MVRQAKRAGVGISVGLGSYLLLVIGKSIERNKAYLYFNILSSGEICERRRLPIIKRTKCR